VKKILIIIIFITGCSSNKNELDNNLSDIKFSDEMTFDEFKINLKKYAENNSYPNINN
tara:strand:+ start:1017 stop:1190 length:174 start_codon:yes stop_codon:yes gene_type:complete